MLKIFFHPGPLKTGTTSIQQYLRRTIGSETPKPVWYPMTTGTSPGHVCLYKGLSGINEKYTGLLEKWIEAAKKNEVEKLIISQEDFSRAQPEVFEKIREVCSGLDIHLVITHRPLKKRVVSQWQEFIKQGVTTPIDDMSEVLDMVSFNPELLQNIAKYLLPDDVSVVTSGMYEAGEKLIRRFVDCLDIEEYISEFGNKIDSNIKINISHGRVEIEFIRHLNILSNYLKEIGVSHDYKFMRRSLVNMMQTPRWRENTERLSLELSSVWEDKVAQMANVLFEKLYADQHAGKLSVYGSLNHILE